MDIPQDIIRVNSVIAAVGDDTRVLKQCALVSSSFLLPSRKQLFSRITSKATNPARGFISFSFKIQSGSPLLEPLFSLTTLGPLGDANLPNGKSLLAILRLPLCCLECFSLNMRHWFKLEKPWESFSSELKDALSNHPPLKPFPSRVSPMYRLPSSSTLSTLRHGSCIPSRRTISSFL